MRAWKLRLTLSAMAGLVLSLAPGQAAHAAPPAQGNCAGGRLLCTEVLDSELAFGEDHYVGHDEPSVLFYSDVPGSGNNQHYLLRLPKDPPTLPNQAGTGGTFNFQLHPAFWFGMVMCDTQSAPEFTNVCRPDSDDNVFDDPNPASPRYLGRHPGGAFMEMQFYPPGWVAWPPGNSCDATRWCAALNIDSFSLNQNTGQPNNAACLNTVGIEPVNFAFITKNGVAQAPAGPVHATLATFTPDPEKDLFMRSGDLISVDMFDTPQGFRVELHDLSTGQHGSMTASPANGFEQVNFRPNDTTCTATPYAFHPMYATSGEHTRLTWTAHSYNVAFSDEIGHFEYCRVVAPDGTCAVAGGTESQTDADDVACFDASQSTRVQVSGCLGTDIDFDGPVYFNNWPGTLTNVALDRKLHAQPVRFTSPTFNGGNQYSRVAFEADLPRIEFATNPPCNRTTGANCVNPPAGAGFYPLYTTRGGEEGCSWQLGGVHIPGTKETFGGSSTTEFGGLLQLTYPGPGFKPFQRFNDFRNVLSSNPCRFEGMTEDQGGQD